MTRRLLVGYLSITLFALAVLVIPLGREFAAHSRDQLLRDIERDAVVVGSLAEEGLESGSAPTGLDAVLKKYAAQPGGRVVIVDVHGHSVLDSSAHPPTRASDFSTRPEIIQALLGRRAEGTRHSNTLHADLVYVAVPVASGGVLHGAVRITYPSAELDRRIASNWLRLGVLSAIVLVAVVIVGFVLAQSVTRPVRRLRAATRKLATGDLSVRVPLVGGPPELRDLATTFNSTTARLEELVDAQRAFVADASHQLRTPLGVLRLRLENLAAELPATSRPRLDAIQSEVRRLGHLVDALLALARADSGQPELRPVDVDAVARERVAMWSPLAEEDGVTLAVDAPNTPVWIVAEDGTIEQVLDNLLSNALDVAPAGSDVTVRVARAGRRVDVHVIDHGRGLPADQRAKAFDRFWRAPDAPGAGSGLGLAIVARLAARSRGDARLDATPGGGVDAVVSLPASPAPARVAI